MRHFEPKRFGAEDAKPRPTRRLLRGIGTQLRQLRWRQLRPRSHRSAGIVLGVLMAITWMLSGTQTLAAVETWDRSEILDAIRFVESGDRDDVPDGDDGKAIGPYQIHNVYWLDATEFAPQLGGTYQDCRQRGYAEQVIDAYMQRHAATAWEIGDGQTIARIHNGGPTGNTKNATLGYWQRVRRRLPAPRERVPE